MITSKQRAALRALANSEEAILQIGKGGFSDNLIKQIEDALEARELIKVTVLENAGISTKEAMIYVCEKCAAQPVQAVGGKFIIYRRTKRKDVKKIQI